MADEVREYVRAAQQAEIRGDIPSAVELLIKAASLYRGSGRSQRAVTMLKHALRLEPSLTELEGQILQLEWTSGESQVERQMKEILSALEPREVAPLELAGQKDALDGLRRRLSLGYRRILLLGPPGAGKSLVLKRLADATRAQLLRNVAELPGATANAPVLFDPEPAPPDTAALRDFLSRHGGPVVLAASGSSPEVSTFVVAGDARVPVHSTAALVEAAGSSLPEEVLELVDAVVSMEQPEASELARAGTFLLEGAGHPESLARGLAPALAQQAEASGRGLHELMALVRRVPKGAVSFEFQPVRKRRPKSRKSEDK
jgi:hypothetical protein